MKSTLCLKLTAIHRPIRISLLAGMALGGLHGGELARPNIIVLLTDDQGYGDFPCNGNPILQTTNLYRVHDEGVPFADFHLSPTCAPTRASLMTGRHEFKSGVTHTILERERMSLCATTIAQVLRSAGYQTGIFGKWHLGDEAEYQPGRRGFDEVFIHGGGGIGQTFPGSCGDAPDNRYTDPVILHNGVFEKTRGYCTDVFFNQAMYWIESIKDRGRFFCYLATNVPHKPLQQPSGYEQRYAGKAPSEAAPFFNMLADLDDNVGRLLARLRGLGLDRNTLLVVMNDNGGTAGVPVFNAGMRGSKTTPWEGGTRAASFWRWPGTFRPAAVKQLAAHIDVYPTLAEIAGATVPAEVSVQLDGRSLVPLLRDPDARWPERYLFTHVGHWDHGQAVASKYRRCRVRNGNFSLVCDSAKGERNWQLFDLRADYGERHDIAADHPATVAAFEKAYDAWWVSIQPLLVNENAVGPKVNPFKAHYWQQFGGRPDEKLRRRMDPAA